MSVKQAGDKVRIEINGEFFSEYHYQHVSRPFLYPLIGPGGAEMSRNWPMKQVEGEERDHPHHKSLWYAHGDVNGHDFWSESAKAGKTVHEKFTELKSGKDAGVIRSLNKLIAKDGTVVCTDERTIRVHNTPANRRILDYDITIRASEGPVTLGDTKEGTMAIRLNESMRLSKPKNQKGEGHIVNSEGVRDGATWGKRAKWCDYYAPLNGKTVGVAIFDHPKNPQHPTWWHVRDYGLFAANPYGVHDFEKKPAGAGNFTIPAGQSATYRYRFYFHEGDEKAADVERFFRDYAAERLAQ